MSRFADMTEPPRLITVTQAADQLHVHPETIRRWIRTGALPATTTPGGHHRINPDDLQALQTQTPV